MINRRRFLQTSSLLSLSPLVPGVLFNAARAASIGPDQPVLIVIQLDGGNDGLNTIVPYGDDAYGRHRVKLRLDAKELHKLDEHVGLHPSLRSAKELFDQGRLTVVQGVGYPNPDRSHFRSMRIWQTARFDDEQHDSYGWLGRALDQQVLDPTATAAGEAIYIGNGETPVSLWGRRSAVTALSRPHDLQLELQEGSLLEAEAGAEASSLEQFVARQMLTAYAAADRFSKQQTVAAGAGSNDYPSTGLGSRLKLISQLLKSGSHARVFYAVQTGYDTHSNQLFQHAQLLREFGDAVKALLDDLRMSQLQDRVIVLAFSEFGRRVQENASQGTDHGTAGPVFLAGDPIRGGLIGAAHNLSDLDGGDLKVQLDFRQLYATILDEWLNVSAHEVLGSAFTPLPIFKA